MNKKKEITVDYFKPEQEFDEKYFKPELIHFLNAGKEFAQKHPAIGSQLSLTEKEATDPFVERLLESFAFLAARIHERLDTEFPEVTGGLLEQLFPHFLRPFPSCTILEVTPIEDEITKPIIIKRHREIQTPVGKGYIDTAVSSGPQEEDRDIIKTEKAEFIFRTTHDLPVRPMKITGVRIEKTSDRTSALVLLIQPFKNIDYQTLDLERLRLYLHGADSLKYSLLLYLLSYTSSLTVTELNTKKPNPVQINPFKIGIPGLSSDLGYHSKEFAILPYARQTFTGYRLLHEYFSYPERFFLIEIEGLKQFKCSGIGNPFEIRFMFDRSFPGDFKPTTKDILLHCVPCVNFFDRMTEPVSLTQRAPEYYIIPDLNRRQSKEIFSVNKVTGISEDRSRQYSYEPTTSYCASDIDNTNLNYKRFYSTVRRHKKREKEKQMMVETHIRIFGPDLEQEVFPKETLSIEATMTNGYLPGEYSLKNILTVPIDFPTGLTVTNLTTMTKVLPYPERENFIWNLLSHLNLNYSTLTDIELFKSILSLYNWSQLENDPNKKRIQAIRKVYPPAIKKEFKNDRISSKIEFKIEVDAYEFPNRLGDVYLFGLILSRFLSQYAAINSSLILIIETKQVTWKFHEGELNVE